ncbi:hypothetical protein ARMGADRAFT_1005083 [Armillaria gallica]|uniref:Reverse transcriptase RNase H-like domain-containing protein n=1 Tax=Armillaria gallica TaxID=47427 RepID=A0A2H3EB20_ARMGA|nr:hypothetical protein ARMGADRAFT_1005083 [Armillaria gallica]
MLAGIETMMCHRNILQGVHFTWITDHKGLIHLMNQKNLVKRTSSQTCCLAFTLMMLLELFALTQSSPVFTGVEASAARITRSRGLPKRSNADTGRPETSTEFEEGGNTGHKGSDHSETGGSSNVDISHASRYHLSNLLLRTQLHQNKTRACLYTQEVQKRAKSRPRKSLRT